MTRKNLDANVLDMDNDAVVDHICVRLREILSKDEIGRASCRERV